MKKHTGTCITILIIACSSLVSLNGCSKSSQEIAPNKPSQEFIKKSAMESFVKAWRENPDVDRTYIIEFKSMISFEDLKIQPLEEKNIVLMADDDGVQRRMWSVVVDGIGVAKVTLCQGLGNIYEAKSHLSYTLYFWEDGAGSTKLRMGKVTAQTKILQPTATTTRDAATAAAEGRESELRKIAAERARVAEQAAAAANYELGRVKDQQAQVVKDGAATKSDADQALAAKLDENRKLTAINESQKTQLVNLTSNASAKDDLLKAAFARLEAGRAANEKLTKEYARVEDLLKQEQTHSARADSQIKLLEQQNQELKDQAKAK